MRLTCSTVGLFSVAVVSSMFGACGGSTTGDGSGGLGGTIGGANGTTANGGTIVTSGVGGGNASGNGGGSSVSADAACVANVQEGEAIPVNLHFLVDRSGSMTCPLGPAGQTCGVGNNGAPNNRMPPDRWSGINDALNAFVAAPQSTGIGVALQFFPLDGGGNNNNNACNRASYQIPALGFGILPAAAMGFRTTLAGTMPNGNTPTTPALQGALDFARGQRVANPSREVSVVLVSDGIPNGCDPNTVATASAAAAAALAATPSIKTYVIGVGPQLMSLDAIAVAGGTQRAYLVDTGADVATQFRQALDAIAAPITCDYAIPAAAPGRAIDFGAVNVQTRVGNGGATQIVGQVANVGACNATGGWFYDNPAAPAKITLCPATCTPLTNTMGSRLQILLGCATQSGMVR
jgi:hypothetical protein